MDYEIEFQQIFRRLSVLEESAKTDRTRYESGQEQITFLKRDLDEWRIESKVRDEVFAQNIKTISTDVKTLAEELVKSRGVQEQKQKNDEQSIRTWRKISLITTVVFGFCTMVATIAVSFPSSSFHLNAKFLFPQETTVSHTAAQ